MKAKLVRIGNSRGVRLPKAILDQCQLGDEVELTVEDGKVVIMPASHPRAGWEEAFQSMAARGDAALVDAESGPPADWDGAEWEW